MVKRWMAFQALSFLPMFLSFYIPLYARQIKGADTYIVGLMDSAYWLIVVVLDVPIGLAADRYGRKKMIALLTPVYSLSLVLLVFSPNDIVLVIAGMLSGFLFLNMVTQGAIGLELVLRELLGSWNALNAVARGLLGIIAPLLGGLIWESLGPNYLFYFLAFLYLARLVIIQTVPDTVDWT